MLKATAVEPGPYGSRLFDAKAAGVVLVSGPSSEHLVVDRTGDPVRIDIVGGSVTNGPVGLRFELDDDDQIALRMQCILAFRSEVPTKRCRPQRLAGQMRALQAVDARGDGASLREVADLLLGPGDWPGDGEHRKSQIRRMIAVGEHLLHAGPRAVLENR